MVTILLRKDTELGLQVYLARFLTAGAELKPEPLRGIMILKIFRGQSTMLKNILRFFRLKRVVVATGGGFDPLHEGHIRLFKEAKKLGDVLIVMLNSDAQLVKKKGNTFYLHEHERKEIVESIKYVDKVIIDPGQDVTCEAALNLVKPDILAKGGDRVAGAMPEVELKVCQELGIKIVYNVGGDKVQSSSWLLKRHKGG
jgi:cytidyltransferase-like protein